MNRPTDQSRELVLIKNPAIFQGLIEGEQTQVKKALIPGEGKVGTYREMKKISKPGDNLTPNHIPQNAYMNQKGVSIQEGITMMMEHPHPGTGGRHRATRTYGKQPDLSVNPPNARQELGRDILDVRRIYQQDNLYTPEIRQSLQEVIDKNKQSFPNLYKKQDGVIQ